MTQKMHGGKACNGSSTEEGSCNDNGCPVDCQWIEWGMWSTCTASCGGGVTQRARTVAVREEWGGQRCNGTASEEEACNAKGCPVDCKWSNWDVWTACSKTCGTGQTRRDRRVVVVGAFGGKACDGRPYENMTCNEQGCPVDCIWGDWSSWTLCTATCGNGSQARSRIIAQKRAFGGIPCQGFSKGKQRCSLSPCPVDCEWETWGAWSTCSVSCGGGVSNRTRATMRKKEHGGQECLGLATEPRDCNKQPCPVDCKWEDWGSWSICSLTCGAGVRKRSRAKQVEQSGGAGCIGDGVEEGQCNKEALGCPTAAPGSAPDVEKDAAATTKSAEIGNCTGGPALQAVWPGDKKLYCCEHHNVACEVTTTTLSLNDCITPDVSLSQEKRGWCCKQFKMGCDVAAESVQNSRASWGKGTSPTNISSEQRGGSTTKRSGAALGAIVAAAVWAVSGVALAAAT